MLEVGDKAPDFTLMSGDNKEVSLKGFQDKSTVVLYFYPKDDTPGCTKEACSFRDNLEPIESKGAVILGISPDGVDAHSNFAKKYNLPFTLLSDPDKVVADAYGVYKERTMYGKKSMGIERSTFIIGKEGNIEHIFRRVRVDGHTEKVLEKLS